MNDDRYVIVELERPDLVVPPSKSRFHLANGRTVDACFFPVPDMEEIVHRASYVLDAGRATLQLDPGYGMRGHYAAPHLGRDAYFVCAYCDRHWTITEREYFNRTAVCLDCQWARGVEQAIQLVIVIVMTAVGIVAAVHATRRNAIAQIGLMYG